MSISTSAAGITGEVVCAAPRLTQLVLHIAHRLLQRLRVRERCLQLLLLEAALAPGDLMAWQSAAISGSGRQRSSAVVSGHQRSSAVISGHHLSSSVVIGHHRSSAVFTSSAQRSCSSACAFAFASASARVCSSCAANCSRS